MSAIRSLCDKVLLLNKGQLKSIGNTGDVLSEYLSAQGNRLDDGETIIYDQNLPDNGIIKLHSLKLYDKNNKLNDTFENCEPIYAELTFSLTKKVNYLVIGLDLKRSFEELVFRSFHNDLKEFL